MFFRLVIDDDTIVNFIWLFNGFLVNLIEIRHCLYSVFLAFVMCFCWYTIYCVLDCKSYINCSIGSAYCKWGFSFEYRHWFRRVYAIESVRAVSTLISMKRGGASMAMGGCRWRWRCEDGENPKVLFCLRSFTIMLF